MPKRFLIIENIENPIITELKEIEHPNGYVVFNITDLKSIPKKILNTLNNRGLFMTEKEDRKNYNPITSLHRLCACIRYNIQNLTIHHIDKNKKNNDILNLLPVTQEENNKYELLEQSEQIALGKKKLREYIATEYEKRNKRRKTLANNLNLQKEIILFSITNPIQKVIKKYKKKIKTIQTIRDIVSYFFYSSEFLKWLEVNNCNSFED